MLTKLPKSAISTPFYLEFPIVFSNFAVEMKKESKVLVILTGGTITMVCDRESGALLPADMETFKAFVP